MIESQTKINTENVGNLAPALADLYHVPDLHSGIVLRPVSAAQGGNDHDDEICIDYRCGVRHR